MKEKIIMIILGVITLISMIISIVCLVKLSSLEDDYENFKYYNDGLWQSQIDINEQMVEAIYG